MVKNYFINLFNIFKSAFAFSNQNFKKFMPLIWGTIIVQIVLGAPIIYVVTTMLDGIKAPMIAGLIVALILYMATFFFMFKKVFELASISLEKEKISNLKVITSLIFMGLFNCIPALFALACFFALEIFPEHVSILQTISTFFSHLFYLTLCLAIVSIIKWQDKNVVVALFNSIKAFFHTIKYSMIVFVVMFILANVVSFLICASLFAIAIYFNQFSEATANSIHAIVNVYCLYVFAGFYIGAQAEILKKLDKKQSTEEEPKEENCNGDL